MIATPQEFLFSIYGMKMLDAEMALIEYIDQIKEQTEKVAIERYRRMLSTPQSKEGE